MPTIAYIASQFPLRSETFVWREVRELRRRGWTVHTFALREPAESTPHDLLELRETTEIVYGGSARFAGLVTKPGLAVRGVCDGLFPREPMGLADRAKPLVQAAAGAWLGRRLRDLGCSHVHAHFAHAPAGVAMYAARVARIPFSFTGHANDIFQRRQLLARKLQRAAFVSCISRWHRELYCSVTKRDDAGYPVIRCGVDTDTWTPATTREPGPVRILSVGRLVEKKGIDVLVRAAHRLMQNRRDFRLTIAGDGPMRARLEGLVRELSLGDRVTMCGAVDSGRVLELMRGHDVMALPCRVDPRGDRDGIPVVLMEAMACGLAVVSGDLPAVRELVTQESGGLLVDATVVDPLASALAGLIDDASLRERLGRAGRERVAAEFSLAENVGRLERAIEAARGS